jgi:hypothetical protein
LVESSLPVVPRDAVDRGTAKLISWLNTHNLFQNSKVYSPDHAKRFEEFDPSREQLLKLGEVGKNILENFPYAAGACAAMSAMFAARWEIQSSVPIYVVAGELYVGGQRAFGKDNLAETIDKEINQSNPSWDGHFWIAFGQYVADVSVFRTARSDHSPPTLARHINPLWENTEDC